MKYLLTIFWQPARTTQIATELDDGIILIKDETTGEPIGLELLSYRPDDQRLDRVSIELGQTNSVDAMLPT